MKRINKRIFVLCAVFMSITFVSAQSTYDSPYSRFGLGDIFQLSNAMNGAMGGLKYGISSAFLVNPSNPASYSAFTRNYFVFDAGLQGSMVRMTSGEQTRDDGHFALGSMTFGIPLSEKWNAALGLVPYSSVGYSISDPGYHEDFGGYNTIFEGNGGISRLFLGASYKIGERFSLGANANYLFGSQNYLQTVTFDSINFINVRSEKSRIVSDVAFDAGIQYRHPLNTEKGTYLTAGLSAGIPGSLSAREDILMETFRFSGSGAVITLDTVKHMIGEKGKIIMPINVAGGLSIRRSDRWMAGFDLALQDWSDFEAFGRSDSLTQSFQVAIGGEYKINNWYLRSGMRFNQTYLQLKGSQLNEYGISFGIGIPVYNKSYSVSMLSAGIEIGQRGTKENGLIKESFSRLWLNFTMNQERWFKRREYL